MTLEFASQYLTRDEWINRYDAANSRHNARYALVAFDDFINAKFQGKFAELYESLRKDEDWRYRFLDNMYQYWKSQGKSVNTLSNYFMFIKSWLRSQGIKTTNEEIKQAVKMSKRINEIRSGLTYETIRLMLSHCNEFYTALYLTLASSGMRVGEATTLLIGDIDFSVNPVRVHIRAENTKTREERYTFISGEAAKALNGIISGRANSEKVFEITPAVAELQMSRLRRRCGLTQKYASGLYHTNIHAFRAFFRTKVGSQNKDLAEKLLGHRGYLSQYVRYSVDELASEYAKVEGLVTISAEHRLEEENTKLRNRVESIDVMERKLQEYEDRIKILEKTGGHKK